MTKNQFLNWEKVWKLPKLQFQEQYFWIIIWFHKFFFCLDFFNFSGRSAAGYLFYIRVNWSYFFKAYFLLTCCHIGMMYNCSLLGLSQRKWQCLDDSCVSRFIFRRIADVVIAAVVNLYFFQYFLSVTDKRNGRIFKAEQCPSFGFEINAMETCQRDVRSTEFKSTTENLLKKN